MRLTTRRFPFAALNPLRRLCLASRLGMIAEYRLSNRSFQPIPEKPVAPFQLTSMAGKSHIGLLKESLHSFARNSSLLPPLTIISDGSLAAEDFTSELKFWPGPIRVVMPEEVMSSCSTELRTLLSPLVNAHPLGLKLAGIISLSRSIPMLFIDSDILWFSDPIIELPLNRNSIGVSVTREVGCSLNRFLAEKYAPEILNAPSVNTGCVWTNRDLSNDPLLLELLHEAGKRPDEEFNEQTILGILAARSDGYLPAKFCMIEYFDAFYLHRRKPWIHGYISRHYVRFMRHQFYRDALSLRGNRLI